MAKNSIIGTFKGKSADSQTNENEWKITKEGWETIFNSEDYKRGIELGFFIGFLGHPEDPGCQDFEHGCIVLTDAGVDDNGEVWAEFNLIDTPVGRIVKSFIDAGVQFGISVRGAGDIYSGEVDAETFIFRGFDLVVFPAYPDAIPTFTELAASSDIHKRQKYKSVCAAIKRNIGNIYNTTALDTIQHQFRRGSAEYKLVQAQKEYCSQVDENVDNIRLNGVTDLYINQIQANQKLSLVIEQQQKTIKAYRKVQQTAKKQIHNYETEYNKLDKDNAKLQEDNEILGSKYKSAKNNIKQLKRQVEASSNIIKNKNDDIRKLEASNQSLSNRLNTSLSKNTKLLGSIDRLQSELDKAEYKKTKLTGTVSVLKSRLDKERHQSEEYIDDIDRLSEKLSKVSDIKARKLSNSESRLNIAETQFEAKLNKLQTENSQLKASIEELQNNNLKYKRELNQSTEELNNLQSTYRNTVSELEQANDSIKEIDSTNEELELVTSLLSEYQIAYATLYAQILGIASVDTIIPIHTSVQELKDIISNQNNFEDEAEIVEEIDFDGIVDDTNSLITM